MNVIIQSKRFHETQCYAALAIIIVFISYHSQCELDSQYEKS